MLLFAALFFAVCYGMLVYAVFAACGKTPWLEALPYSLAASAAMTAAYYFRGWLGFIVDPVNRFLLSVGTPLDWSVSIAQGYVLMLISWPIMVWIVLQAQRLECKPTGEEKAKFKSELEKNLLKLRPNLAPAAASGSGSSHGLAK